MKKDKKLLCVTCLLVFSLVLNFNYMFDYYPMPKETESLDWNSDYTYTLAYPDDKSESIIISIDKNNNPKQYVKLGGFYSQILMIDNGLIVSNEEKSIELKNKDGILEEVENSQFFDLGSFVESELIVGVMGELHLQKKVIANKVESEELEKEVLSDAAIYQTYPLKYEDAFVINGVNYIPRDFDNKELRE